MKKLQPGEYFWVDDVAAIKPTLGSFVFTDGTDRFELIPQLDIVAPLDLVKF